MIIPVPEKLIAAAAIRMGKVLQEPARSLGIKALASLRGYTDYLNETYRRVSTFKSFANPAQLVSVLDHFVAPDFQSSNHNVPDFDIDKLLEGLNAGERFVVSALAGYGKSMVLRYIALSLYESPRGQIPLFVELRHLNRVTSPNLLAYINATYSSQDAVSLEAFKRNLESGTFIILLDGFDELSHDIRKDIESQIVAIASNFPMTAMVVSGRPDNDRFFTWKDFELIKIKAMTLPQIVSLITKLDYDLGVKRRFAAKVRRELYEQHKSFMSTPLLAILMLLTFEKNAVIPEKLHLFYAQAFEVLFHQHDAMKDQYERQRKSGLQIDEFQDVFSTFCIRSYSDEATEFTEAEITKYLRESIGYANKKTEPNEILFDITECVCLLMKEGGSYYFIHRSFQEYFTAVFLAGCKPETRNAFLNTIGNRPWDSVLPMLFEMASAQLEPSWIRETVESYFAEVGTEPGKIHPFNSMATGFIAERNLHRAYAFHLVAGAWHTRISVLSRFYPSIEIPVLKASESLNNFVFENWDQLGGRITSIKRTKARPALDLQEISISKIPESILSELGLQEMHVKMHAAIKRIANAISKEERSRDRFIREMFSRS